MRTLLALVVAGSLVTGTASGATCIGKNCDLIDLAARGAGLSLDRILTEIDRNIVDPIVDSQKGVASWEGGMLQFTPRGSEGGVKVTLWGGGAWKSVDINSTMFGASVNFGYYTGNSSLALGVEIPFDKKTDLILNGAFWSGASDYGTGLAQENMRETSGRFGMGIRQKFYSVGIADAFVLGGFVIGHRQSDMTLGGTTIAIRYPGGRITWMGEEKYSEKATYVSTPALLGVSFNVPGVTLTVSGGGSVIYQQGRIDLSKWGPVGPYGGYYNVGATSDRDTSGFTLVPMVTLGAETGLERGPSLSVNFRPGLNNSPVGGSVGLGWKFLVSK
jgi:hypothetical protein